MDSKRVASLAVLLILLVGCSRQPEEPEMNLLESGILKVGDYECEVDPKESYLRAHLDKDGISWELKIQAKDSDEFYEYDERDEEADIPFARPSLYVFFQSENLADWRELSGFSTKIHYPEEPTLLPDNPAGAYLGYHLFANNHDIHIGRNKGNLFQVKWSCDGRESQGDDPTPFYVNAVVGFDGVQIGCEQDFRLAMEQLPSNKRQYPDPEELDRLADEWQPDMQAANVLLSQHLELQDFRKPEKMNWALWYAVVEGTE